MSLDSNIYLSYKAQIVIFKDNNVFIYMVFKYVSFLNVFLMYLVIKLLESTKIDNYIIDLINS